MTAKLTFYWLRHAPPVNPYDLCYGSDMDVDVSDRNALKVQAARLPLGATWHHTLMPRTLKTARALAGHHPESATIAFRTAAALSEQSFGAWTGLSRSDMRKHPAFPAYIDNPEHVAPPMGESLLDLAARVKTDLDLKIREPGDKVIVSHAGTIRAAIHIATGISMKHALKYAIEPLSLTIIRYDPARLENPWRLMATNLKP